MSGSRWTNQYPASRLRWALLCLAMIIALHCEETKDLSDVPWRQDIRIPTSEEASDLAQPEVDPEVPPEVDVTRNQLCDTYQVALPQEPASKNVRCGLSRRDASEARPLGAICSENAQCASGYCLDDPSLVARTGRICTAQCSSCSTIVSCGDFVPDPWKSSARCVTVSSPLSALPAICVVVCGSSASERPSVDCSGLGTACVDSSFLNAGTFTVRTCLPACDS